MKLFKSKYDKVLNRSNKALGIKPKPMLKPILKGFRGLNLRLLIKVKDFILKLINPLKTAPLSVLFVFFVIAMVLIVLVANQIRMKHFSNVLVKAYPEISVVLATPEGKPLYPSIIDKVLSEFNAINNIGYLMVFMVFFVEFLKGVQYGFIPRKPQVWRR